MTPCGNFAPVQLFVKLNVVPALKETIALGYKEVVIATITAQMYLLIMLNMGISAGGNDSQDT